MSSTNNSRLTNISYRRLSQSGACLSLICLAFLLSAADNTHQDTAALATLLGGILGLNVAAITIKQDQFIQHFIAAACIILSGLCLNELLSTTQITDLKLEQASATAALIPIVVADTLKLIKNP